MDSTGKRITKPDGTVLELVETVPAEIPARRPSRTKARKQALDVLYASELRGVSPDTVVADREDELRPFAADLLAVVAGRREEIDSRLSAALAADWSLDRMPSIDRCLARLAVAELLTGSVAPEVAIEQAASLATELSTEDSAAFLNGLLSAVLRAL